MRLLRFAQHDMIRRLWCKSVENIANDSQW